METAGRWIARTGAFSARGRRFPPDCSGFVEAVYESGGIPIRDAFAVRPRDEGSAAAALHRVLRDKLGVLYGAEREPLPGDLVFFEETYDRNRNGKVDDGITHVGLVEEIRPDGTVVFLHRNGKGVARARLHPKDPSSPLGPAGEARNTRLRALRRRGGALGARSLAGELFAGFGRIDPARVAAALDGNERLDLAALGYEEGPPLAELPAGVLPPPEGR